MTSTVLPPGLVPIITYLLLYRDVLRWPLTGAVAARLLGLQHIFSMYLTGGSAKDPSKEEEKPSAEEASTAVDGPRACQARFAGCGLRAAIRPGGRTITRRRSRERPVGPLVAGRRPSPRYRWLALAASGWDGARWLVSWRVDGAD